DSTEEAVEDEVDKQEADDIVEVGEIIADDDTLKDTLVNIEHKVDDMFDEASYWINLELENKHGGKIMVQARDVSVDGTMVDDMVFFSEEIAEGKKANRKLDIQNYDGDLPEMNEDLEFKLVVIDDETFDTIEEYDVSFSF